jgi:hypothetical protein
MLEAMWPPKQTDRQISFQYGGRSYRRGRGRDWLSRREGCLVPYCAFPVEKMDVRGLTFSDPRASQAASWPFSIIKTRSAWLAVFCDGQ